MRAPMQLLALCLAVTACSGDADPVPATPTATSPATSATPTPSPAPSSPSAMPSEDATATASESTTGGLDGASEDSGLESSVGTSTSNVTSSVEVRVADIISDFDGETTTEGTALTIPGEVLFDTDEDTLRPQARTDLDEVVEVLAFYDDAPVEIVGHTDSRSSDDYNQDLSERRATAVAAYLRDAGIRRGRMAVEGRGESEPVADNDTADGRQQNRRVVVTVVGVEPPDVD